MNPPSTQFTAEQLEAMMIKMYGPDFRKMSIVGPLGTFHLGSVFEECGLVDPKASTSTSGAYGIWQFS